MSIIIFTYTFVWHIFGSVAMYATMTYYGPLQEYYERGITHAWFSVFMTSSCLNNVGLSLLNDSCMAMTDRTGTLLIMGWAIVLGAGPAVRPPALRVRCRHRPKARSERLSFPLTPNLCVFFALPSGNTAYPIVLRAILEISHRIWPQARSIKFCLDNPQRRAADPTRDCYRRLSLSHSTCVADPLHLHKTGPISCSTRASRPSPSSSPSRRRTSSS